MELDIFTCECLLDRLIMMRNETKEEIISKTFSIANRPDITCITLYINKILFFCYRCIGILEVEKNCARILTINFEKYLIKIKK